MTVSLYGHLSDETLRIAEAARLTRLARTMFENLTESVDIRGLAPSQSDNTHAHSGQIGGGGVPGPRCVVLTRRSELRTVYARAREVQGDALDDEMAHLTSRMLAGELDHNSVRVALNNMQWRAARKNPRRYGDKLDANITGDIIVHGLEKIKGS